MVSRKKILNSGRKIKITPPKKIISLPTNFSFKHHDYYDFDHILSIFDWTISNETVLLDFSKCGRANYQALSLLVLYSWHLKSNGCRVEYKLHGHNSGASKMWRLMGAVGLFEVSTNDNQNFKGHAFKPLLAIRNQNDFRQALTKTEEYVKGFNIEYKNTLRYVVTELLYNTLEHGTSYFSFKNKERRLPSLIQFMWYRNRNEIHFIIADLGIGIKKHLEQTYTAFESDELAIRKAIRPHVSGTFGRSDPYQSKNNAGVGLFLSTNIVRKLNADMRIVSGNGLLHVSPRDITGSSLKTSWPGTFVLVNIRLENNVGFSLDNLMAEFRSAADKELGSAHNEEDENTHYLSIINYFGPYAEDKEACINYRDSYLIPAADEEKTIIIDFRDVESSPHSFLSALLATPIRRIGIKAYKKIKIVNALPGIRETIDYIMDDNT